MRLSFRPAAAAAAGRGRMVRPAVAAAGGDTTATL